MDINILKKYVPFSELDDKYLEDALEHIEEKDFHKGDMLFKRGRTTAERFYILAGRVDLIDAGYNATNVDTTGGVYANALNLDSPTRTSCIAKSAVKVFSIPTEALDRIVSWSESAAYANEVQQEDAAIEEEGFELVHTGEIEVSSISDDNATDWMSSLLQSPLFTRIPLTQVQELFTRFKDLPVEKGSTVLKEGEQGDYFYVLASGRARVSDRLNSIDVILEPGSYFGEEALLGNTTRNATVEMLDNGIVKRLDSVSFENLLKAPILQYLNREDLDQLDKPYKILDVKMPIEYRAFHVKGSINFPLSRLRTSMMELAKSSAYIVANDAGSRADIAAHLLCQAGFDAFILNDEGAVTESE